MKKPLSLMALGLAVVLTLSACSSDDSPSSSSSSSSAAFNDADVSFASEMIPHHRQAVEMSEMAKSRASSPEVRSLAADIEAAQGPEIDTMSRWLEDWGQDVPSDSSTDGMGGMDMGEGQMPGMMSSEEMGDLERLDGAPFDRMFLTMMIAHHEGAIEMAQAEQRDGRSSEATDLAQQIEDAQTTEIATMRQLLGA